MLVFLFCIQKSHQTWELLGLKWLEVKECYKEALYMCHSKAALYPFLETLLYYMDAAWLRTLNHQKKLMQLQETGFDGHLLNNRMLSKESKIFVFQKAIAQKNFFLQQKG